MHFYVSGLESLVTSEQKVEIPVKNLTCGTIFPKSVEPTSAYDIPTSIRMTLVGELWLRDGGEALAREDIDVGIDDDERR